MLSAAEHTAHNELTCCGSGDKAPSKAAAAAVMLMLPPPLTFPNQPIPSSFRYRMLWRLTSEDFSSWTARNTDEKPILTLMMSSSHEDFMAIAD